MGIGRTDPETRLDVGGSATVRGDLTVTGTLNTQGWSSSGNVDLANHNLQAVGALELADGGANEGIWWSDQANQWAIDASAQSWSRTECDAGACDLHIYGSDGSVRMWRPLLMNAPMELANQPIRSVGVLELSDGGANEGVRWPQQANLWAIDASANGWVRAECDGGDCDLHVYGAGGDVRMWRKLRVANGLNVESGQVGIGTPSPSAQLDVRGGNATTPAVHSQGGIYVSSVNAGTAAP